jgi:lipoate-protein ligase B
MQTTKQSTFRTLAYADLGLIEYAEAWRLQKILHEKRRRDEINDTLLLLEHPHTYTLGKVADTANILADEEFLNEHDISVFEIDRGGDVTYHGPGQIVGYAIINLAEWKKDTHEYLRALEQTVINTCEELGVSAGRNPEYTGVWVGENKICAIGVKVSRWITMHGFAFNVNPELKFFESIIPCGIKGKGVTSLKKETGKEYSLNEIKIALVKNFMRVFSYSEKKNFSDFVTNLISKKE